MTIVAWIIWLGVCVCVFFACVFVLKRVLNVVDPKKFNGNVFSVEGPCFRSIGPHVITWSHLKNCNTHRSANTDAPTWKTLNRFVHIKYSSQILSDFKTRAHYRQGRQRCRTKKQRRRNESSQKLSLPHCSGRKKTAVQVHHPVVNLFRFNWSSPTTVKTLQRRPISRLQTHCATLSTPFCSFYKFQVSLNWIFLLIKNILKTFCGENKSNLTFPAHPKGFIGNWSGCCAILSFAMVQGCWMKFVKNVIDLFVFLLFICKNL